MNDISRRILITRAQPGAAMTAQRLRAAGHEPLVMPLLQLQPLMLAQEDQSQLKNFEGDIIFTSANGVRFSPADLSRTVSAVWCVGDATAEAARQAGYRNVRSANGSARQLIELIRNERDPRLASFIHLSHAAPRGHIVETLQDHGYRASRISLYDARPTHNYAARLNAAQSNGRKIDAVIIHSPAAGQRFANLWREEQLEPFAPPLLAAISEAAAEPLREIAGDRLKVAEHPSETALIGLIESG